MPTHMRRYLRSSSTGIYYVSNSGSDTDTGTRPDHPWQTIAKVNASTFQPGNRVLFKCGDLWREQLTIPSSGTTERPITFGAYGSGNLPRIYGSAQISTWTNESGSLWYATCATDPLSVWFVNADATLRAGKKEALKASLDVEYDWWFDLANTRLYIFAATSPDTRYTSVEKPARPYCIYENSKDYFKLSNLDCSFSQTVDADSYGVIQLHYGTGIVVEYCKAHHSGVLASNTGNGIYLDNTNAPTVRYNTCYFNGRRGIVGFLTDAGKTIDNVLIEHNEVYNNSHAGIDLFRNNVAGSFNLPIVRYNRIYNDSDYGQGLAAPASTHGILAAGPVAASAYRITNVKIYGNLIFNQYNDQGIELPRRAEGVEIYNNTIYGQFTGATLSPTAISRSTIRGNY